MRRDGVAGRRHCHLWEWTARLILGLAKLSEMRRWVEVLLVVVLVALAARLFVPGQSERVVHPSKDVVREHPPTGGYAIVGPETGHYLGGPDGGSQWGKRLTYDGKTILQATDPREKVVQVLGKPVGFNSDNSKWGYWTRGLPNPKMGILISFNKQNEIEQIDLASDWSRLATQMALDSRPMRR